MGTTGFFSRDIVRALGILLRAAHTHVFYLAKSVPTLRSSKNISSNEISDTRRVAHKGIRVKTMAIHFLTVKTLTPAILYKTKT